ncbi:hypothetical protein MtrunA17_Chr4g0075931 [Medicago truncatula]|uniref:Uncharacterized protein n=1 Tax=Medicago truncatula TaxID=3880 RepID=A0A396IHK3_MEDTR|nr:hypothetical protein MtrunA17_Chr4g0075931 [Medicago truncatula]
MKEFFLTDDTGYLWKCTNTFVCCPNMLFKIGGSWKQYCQSCRVREGAGVRIGAPKRVLIYKHDNLFNIVFRFHAIFKVTKIESCNMYVHPIFEQTHKLFKGVN